MYDRTSASKGFPVENFNALLTIGEASLVATLVLFLA
jgi:hypothetical protein